MDRIDHAVMTTRCRELNSLALEDGENILRTSVLSGEYAYFG
jgi:hypothetical protein